MSLTRGAASNFPCPICRVDRDELTDLANTWPLRTAAQLQELVKQARGLTRVSDREALLSSQGLRDIDVSTYSIPFYVVLLMTTYRMYFGTYPTQTHIARCLSIGFILTTADSLATTFGKLSKAG